MTVKQLVQQLDEYMKIDGRTQKDLIIPSTHLLESMMKRFTPRKIYDICVENKVRLDLEYNNLKKDAYGTYMSDPMFNYFRLFR